MLVPGPPFDGVYIAEVYGLAVAPRPPNPGENNPVLIELCLWKKQETMGKSKTAFQQGLFSGWRFIAHYFVLFKRYLNAGASDSNLRCKNTISRN